MLLRAHWRPRFYSTSTKVQTVIVAYETKKETKPGREPTTIHRKKKPHRACCGKNWGKTLPVWIEPSRPAGHSKKQKNNNFYNKA